MYHYVCIYILERLDSEVAAYLDHTANIMVLGREGRHHDDRLFALWLPGQKDVGDEGFHNGTHACSDGWISTKQSAAPTGSPRHVRASINLVHEDFKKNNCILLFFLGWKMRAHHKCS